jgi:4-amino-4-deoxy-L-arabinose transferase-like glycosyltransferase
MACREISVTPETKVRSCPHYAMVVLLLILSLAIFLRLFKLGQSPPGLNQDEAANAWSAYCLLKTGKDYYYRTSWPIFYVRNVGGNSSTLYVYSMIPFQAIGGLNVYTTRLPAALGGAFAVWLIYFVGRRLFGSAIAITAAALLAIDPWHLQHSRNGLESSITPLVSLAPLALLLWAGLLSGDKNKTVPPRPFAAALGGALTGIGCYGHWEVRLFVPAFLFLIILFTLPSWWKTIKTKKGALAVALFFLGFAATWGPLIWQHIFYPESISRHALSQKDWIGSVPFLVALKNIAVRYIQHFGPYFLFTKGGGSNWFFTPPGMGQFYWYMAPLMLTGLISLIWRFKSSFSARVIIAFVLAYPVGDCLVWGTSLSILRSAPGLCALILLSAVGVVDAARWLWAKNRNAAIVAAVIFSITVIGINLKYLYRFYVISPRETNIYHYFHTDLVESCKWLKPRFDDFDAIYITTNNFNMPYVITTVVLGYDPKKWFSEPIEVNTPGEWDIYTRYGKMYFIYDYKNFSINELQKKYAPNKLLVVLRPSEFVLITAYEKLKELENSSDDAAISAIVQNINLEPSEASIPKDLAEKIIHKIYGPDGKDTLWLCRF